MLVSSSPACPTQSMVSPAFTTKHSFSDALKSPQASAHRSIATSLRTPVKSFPSPTLATAAAFTPQVSLHSSGRADSQHSRKERSPSPGLPPPSESTAVMVHAKAGTGLGLPICKQVCGLLLAVFPLLLLLHQVSFRGEYSTNIIVTRLRQAMPLSACTTH